MQFGDFAKKLALLDEVRSRNAMMALLSELFTELSSSEIKPACYLLLGRIAPLYDRVEFNLAEKMVMRSLSLAFGVDVQQVGKHYKDEGDLGSVVVELKTLSKLSGRQNLDLKTRNSQLSLNEVFRGLSAIAHDSGEGSQERKVSDLAALLTKLDGLSAKYVVRMVLGKLRLGFSDKTMLDALSMMVVGDKGKRGPIEEAYQLLPDVGEIARLVKEYGANHLSEVVDVTVGIPVIPALAQRLRSADEMIKKMGTVAVEPKYDGTRVQIHYAIGDDGYLLKTFTRNLDENSHMFPELQEGVKQIQAESVILDGEAIGVDPVTGALLSFQMTITRKRKHGIVNAAALVPLKFFVFDLLYINGVSLVGEPFEKRRAQLEEVVGVGDILVVDPVEVTRDPVRLRALHAQYLADGLEGAVIKKIDGKYTPGRRGWNWVKFKEVEEASGKLSDTLDVVVLGYYLGKGKRVGFGIGAFLVGVLSSEGYVTIAKIGTGLSDSQWKTLKYRLEMQVVAEKPLGYRVDDQLACDVWVEPSVVVEVAADEITNSPLHSAGLALRFPRLVRFRDDKSADQATTVDELKTIRKLSS